MLCDYHIHSVYSDGSNTPEQLVEEAVNKGLEQIGISDHSYTFFDKSYCMQKEKIDEYLKSISDLKKRYENRIKIFCGIEQDYYSDESTKIYDYSIGSVHYVKVQDEYIPIDETKEILKNAADKYFFGDMLSLCELYFETLSNVITKTNCRIIGHFDLISKFNKNDAMFDENDSRYVDAWKKCADKLLKYDVPFEINTSSYYRGLRYDAYPKKEIREYIKQNNGKFILSSDSHDKKNICSNFDLFIDSDTVEVLFE